jgi:hypothetical protein
MVMLSEPRDKDIMEPYIRDRHKWRSIPRQKGRKRTTLSSPSLTFPVSCPFHWLFKLTQKSAVLAASENKMDRRSNSRETENRRARMGS